LPFGTVAPQGGPGTPENKSKHRTGSWSQYRLLHWSSTPFRRSCLLVVGNGVILEALGEVEWNCFC
jgi:hypothetical protein